MEFKIRKIKENDRCEILSMMEDFYSSEAVFTNGSKEIFTEDFEQCINNSPYLEGYIFSDDSITAGYAMIAKSFSTEFGKPCIWLEDLYLKSEYRGFGIIPKFIQYIESLHPNSVLRLEAEEENIHALHVYKKSGFTVLPYLELIKNAH